MNFKSTALLCAAFSLAAASQAEAAKFPIKLFLSSDGLALSSFPSKQVLKEKITVKRTQGKTKVTWTAASDQPWLSATSTGQTGDALTVTADPAQVKKDKSNLARVTISTSGGDFTDTETLYVGFWVSGKDPVTPLVVQQNGIALVANPVRPDVYVTDGSSTVFGYNVYTGKLDSTWQTPAAKIGTMEVSSNGQALFVSDTQNKQIVALNTKTGAENAAFPIGYALSGWQNMVYARPFGQPALYLSGGPILSVPKGKVLASGLSSNYLAVTPDGQSLYAVEIGIDPATLYNYSVAIGGAGLSVTPITSATISGENCQGFAVSHDGTHVYPACGWPYEFDVYDGQSLQQVQTLPAETYPNNAAIDENDNFVGGLDGIYQTYDVYVYDQKGNSVSEVDSDQSDLMQDGLMRVSGDGRRVLSIDESQTMLMFRTVP